MKGKSVVLGVTGGIAAYKSCEIVSRLRKLGADVYVVMTKNACEFVTPLTFETLSNHPVVQDTFARPERWEVEHVSLAKRADLFLIAPATANIMAKIAHGIADDMLSTTVLATRAQLLLAPAMNTGMWESPATRQNAETLLARGVRMIGPEGGNLACGDIGIGRMSEPCDIVAMCSELLRAQKDMEGKRVLVTAGPTREPIDPVRFITNRSSGKMGYAIAEAAAKRGASVTLVTGSQMPAPFGMQSVIAVRTTEDLYNAMMDVCGEQDIIIQAAAPADYAPAHVAETKLKKRAGEGLVLSLVQTRDVARAVGERKKPGQTLIGFAAETGDGLEAARRKLQEKHLDMIVLNDVTKEGAGFDVDTNIATLITAASETPLPLMRKTALAGVILDKALSLADVR